MYSKQLTHHSRIFFAFRRELPPEPNVCTTKVIMNIIKNPDTNKAYKYLTSTYPTIKIHINSNRFDTKASIAILQDLQANMFRQAFC